MTSALSRPDAESEVIGVLLNQPETLALVRPILGSPACFSIAQLGTVYAAILALSDRGAPIDYVTMPDELRVRGMAEADTILADLMDAGYVSANVEHHAATVLECHQRRLIQAEAKRLNTLAEDRGVTIGEAVAESSTRLIAVLADRATADVTFRTSLLTVMDHLEARVKSGDEISGLSTGFPGLDELTDGFIPGELTLLAARPSQGKTSSALAMARHVADHGPVILYSLEMTQHKLTERLLSAESGANLRWCAKQKYEGYFDRHVGNISRAAAVLGNLPILIHEGSRLRPADLRLSLQARLAQGHAPKLVVIDYLGLMDPDEKQENRNNALGNISAGLKRIAKEFHVPVLALHQLNRANERENRAPMLHDLRDSGNLEQDADNVWMLHWPSGPAERGATSVDLYARKVRNGEVGKVPLLFESFTQRWYEPGQRAGTEAA